MVAPRWRVVAVARTVKIVDARRSAMAEGSFGGAGLLADANMKRDLEVNGLETSETR